MKFTVESHTKADGNTDFYVRVMAPSAVYVDVPAKSEAAAVTMRDAIAKAVKDAQ